MKKGSKYLRYMGVMAPMHTEKKMKIKLTMLFIVMDLLTLLAYPIIFAYGKLRQLSKPKAGIVQAKLLITGSTSSGR